MAGVPGGLVEPGLRDVELDIIRVRVELAQEVLGLVNSYATPLESFLWSETLHCDCNNINCNQPSFLSDILASPGQYTRSYSTAMISQMIQAKKIRNRYLTTNVN